MTSGNATAGSDPRVISQDLLDLLVCPVDKQALRLEGATLICMVCGRKYPIEDGIPNMLVEDDE